MNAESLPPFDDSNQQNYVQAATLYFGLGMGSKSSEKAFVLTAKEAFYFIHIILALGASSLIKLPPTRWGGGNTTTINTSEIRGWVLNGFHNVQSARVG